MTAVKEDKMWRMRVGWPIALYYVFFLTLMGASL